MSGDTEEDDISIEDEHEERSSLTPASTKKLRDKLKQCTEEKQEYLDGWQRAKADLINQNKNFDDRQKSLKNLIQNDFLFSLLPAFDSFDMAFRGEAWERVDDTWKKGVEYIHQQFVKALGEHGVEAYSPAGEQFDPRLHDSLEIRETDNEDEDNTIVEVVQQGYRRGDEVLRPAKVIVTQFKK